MTGTITILSVGNGTLACSVQAGTRSVPFSVSLAAAYESIHPGELVREEAKKALRAALLEAVAAEHVGRTFLVDLGDLPGIPTATLRAGRLDGRAGPGTDYLVLRLQNRPDTMITPNKAGEFSVALNGQATAILIPVNGDRLRGPSVTVVANAELGGDVK